MKQQRGASDIIIFTPKFHAELAPIESAYREVAKVLREQMLLGPVEVQFNDEEERKKNTWKKKTVRNSAQK